MPSRFWPSIPDQVSAERIARSVAKWYVFAAIVSGVLGIASLISGKQITKSEFDHHVVASSFSLLDAALFGWIAYKILSMSVGWSVTGLILALVGTLLSMGAGEVSPIAMIFELYAILRFIHAIRAARAWRRFAAIQAQFSAAPLEPK
jgi:hypothetical protein